MEYFSSQDPAMQTSTSLRLFLATAITTLYAATASAAVWQYDFDAAFNEAVRTQRPLLIHFYGEQCGPCIQMEREVFSVPQVTQFLTSKYVAVKVEAQTSGSVRSGQLVQRFGVHALPTDIVLDPASGKILSQTQAFQPAQNYLSNLASSRSIYDRSHPPAVAQPQQPQPSQPQSPFQQQPSQPAGQFELETPRAVVGLDGFSPVALGAYRQWLPGKPEFAFEYKAVTYYMTSEQELSAFRAHPEKFAPRLLGCDPVVLHDTDLAVQGRTDFGAYFDGDLYLFESDESRRRFKLNPPKYTRIQHVLKIDNIRKIADQPRQQAEVK